MSFTVVSVVLILAELAHLTEGLGIVGGFPGVYYSFFVQIKTDENVCGGTLVNPDAVVTAAHCLFYKEKNRFAYPDEIHVLKSTERTWRRNPKRYTCSGYTYHESYNPGLNHGLGPFDIAVVNLYDSVDLNNPRNGVLAPCPDTTEYGEGIAIGLGLTHTNPVIEANMLMEARLYKHSPCGQHFSKHEIEVDQEKQVCYGSRRINSPAGTCIGDFGGPLVLESFFNEEIICLIGIASFSSQSCIDPLVPSVFIRASYFSEWIRRSVSEQSVYPKIQSREDPDSFCKLCK